MAADSITFIGGGNMARSLIAGLIRQGVPAAHIHVAEPVAELRQALAADFDVQVHDNASDAAAQGGTWLLAVKPQVLREVCQSLQALAQASRPLVVSIAAGITSAQLQRWLGGDLAVVRAMPNTPALLGAGVTGLFATPSVDTQQHARAEQVLASAGRTVWIDSEGLMDSVTAVSGSGPA
ncbi:pyrroline-5-carboxylate reductase, partial [Stenotrophomonas maltophilia]